MVPRPAALPYRDRTWPWSTAKVIASRFSQIAMVSNGDRISGSGMGKRRAIEALLEPGSIVSIK